MKKNLYYQSIAIEGIEKAKKMGRIRKQKNESMHQFLADMYRMPEPDPRVITAQKSLKNTISNAKKYSPSSKLQNEITELQKKEEEYKKLMEQRKMEKNLAQKKRTEAILQQTKQNSETHKLLSDKYKQISTQYGHIR